MASFEDAVEHYNRALDVFVNGNDEPVRQMFSERDDVLLCNPFQSFARGPAEVTEAAKRAASHYANGTIECERVANFVTADMGCIVQIERFTALVEGTAGAGALRVTMIFRREDNGWKVAHRHADPITTPQATASVLQRD